jgi:hypothetical protein
MMNAQEGCWLLEFYTNDHRDQIKMQSYAHIDYLTLIRPCCCLVVEL